MGPLKQHRPTVDDVAVLGTGDMERPEEAAAAKESVAFVAFTLSHSPCGDAVVEARLGEGLLQWCVACDDLRVFRFPSV